MIEYTNISYQEYDNLSEKERKNSYFIEYPRGDKYWKVNSKYHREDGPAIILFNGSVRWYLNGTFYSFDKWLIKTPISDDEKVFLRLKYS